MIAGASSLEWQCVVKHEESFRIYFLKFVSDIVLKPIFFTIHHAIEDNVSCPICTLLRHVSLTPPTTLVEIAKEFPEIYEIQRRAEEAFRERLANILARAQEEKKKPKKGKKAKIAARESELGSPTTTVSGPVIQNVAGV